MKFARLEYQGRAMFGMVQGDEVTVLDGSPLETYRETGTRLSLSEARFLPPSAPTKIVCIGLNFREHIEEIGSKEPERPHFFLKPPSCLIGPEDAIVFPRDADRVDYEGELALVVKNKMKDVTEKDALDHILGFSCFNDVTERTIVTRNIADLTLAKGFDTFGAFGPYVVTGLDPDNLEIKTFLNGELKQHDNTRGCVFSMKHILHYLSRCMTLNSGDIVATGTPKGIAPMKPGDVVEVEIEGIGRLRNIVKSLETS